MTVPLPRRRLSRKRLALIREYAMQHRWIEPATHAGEWERWARLRLREARRA